MNQVRWLLCSRLAIVVVVGAGATHAQAQNLPRIGYAYPAGGQQGAVFDVTIGGQHLDGASQVIVSGPGVQAEVLEHTKPWSQKQLNTVRQKLQEARQRVQAANTKVSKNGQHAAAVSLEKVAIQLGVSSEEFKTYNELRKKLADPKRQPNPQIAETVRVRVTVDADAEPGERELRLISTTGLSNPVYFQVGQLPEYHETEPNDNTADVGISQSPIVVNGQILPGDVDLFRFAARRGERLVVIASARELIPYLADAVPGWFQATLALRDANGRELSYADDFRFHPDPVLYYEIPDDGQYILEIKDAVYRGREDFVYRITLGEVPFVTSVFPLGGRKGEQATVQLRGWNLPSDELTLGEDKRTGIHQVSIHGEQCASNGVPFAVDALLQRSEQEPNDEASSAQKVATPLIVNGRIDRPGDWDVFRFQGRAGETIVAEVRARRLNSPVDSVLELTDADGRQLALSDDHEDKSEGLTTHHADSRLSVSLPAKGVYYLRLGDTQHQGGAEFGYRLRISAPQPDFELRVVPSSVNAMAGSSVPITVHAVRRDGFAGDIRLRLKDPPPGFALSGAWVPAGRDQVRLTLAVPTEARQEPFLLALDGSATIDGQQIRRPAVPADDMMQAFVYRHLVCAKDWLVAVSGRKRFKLPAKIFDEPVKIAADTTRRIEYPTPYASYWEKVQLVLSDPPEGISIGGVSAAEGGASLDLHADAVKVQPGLKGNLIINVFMVRTTPAGSGKPRGKKRFPLGTLPAIPFEITDPDR